MSDERKGVSDPNNNSNKEGEGNNQSSSSKKYTKTCFGIWRNVKNISSDHNGNTNNKSSVSFRGIGREEDKQSLDIHGFKDGQPPTDLTDERGRRCFGILLLSVIEEVNAVDGDKGLGRYRKGLQGTDIADNKENDKQDGFDWSSSGGYSNNNNNNNSIRNPNNNIVEPSVKLDCPKNQDFKNAEGVVEYLKLYNQFLKYSIQYNESIQPTLVGTKEAIGDISKLSLVFAKDQSIAAKKHAGFATDFLIRAMSMKDTVHSVDLVGKKLYRRFSSLYSEYKDDDNNNVK